MASRLLRRLLRPAPTLNHLIFSPPDPQPTPIFHLLSTSGWTRAPSRTKPVDIATPIFHRLLSTSARTRVPSRAKPVDIAARARQLQTRRLWTYALTFSCIAGFVVIVLTNFEDQLVFYVTPTEAMDKFRTDHKKNRFRLGGLVLEGSVTQPASSPMTEFVITDLVTDILVRYEGMLPDLFREGHSVVVEGFVKPFEREEEEEEKGERKGGGVSDKARTENCYFSAVEVLAKHDEKYMPKEVAEAIEKNRKLVAAAGDKSVVAENP